MTPVLKPTPDGPLVGVGALPELVGTPALASTPDPTWRPQLVALDIDGTIVGPDQVIPAAVRAALGRIEAAGVPIVLVTGRAWLSAQVILDDLRLPRTYCICNNGAAICTYPPLELVQLTTFDARPLVAALRDNPTVVVAVEEFGVGYRTTGPFPGPYLLGAIRTVAWADLAPEPVTRLILRDPAASTDEFLAFCRDLNLDHLSYFIGIDDHWLDVASAAVDKAAALHLVADRLGIAQVDVLALGDGYNDLAFLAWAGRGVALGDAPEELQQVATAVAGRFADGGTAAELSRWF
jgi:hydroxymethylpyrimidine pyrophosphatase-like HAD family hydrolase